jgi:hypothetical protein
MVKDRDERTGDSRVRGRCSNARGSWILLLGREGGLWGQTIRLAPPMCITLSGCPDFIVAVLNMAFAVPRREINSSRQIDTEIVPDGMTRIQTRRCSDYKTVLAPDPVRLGAQQFSL